MSVQSPFDLLPDDLLLHIMLQCEPCTLIKSEAVCRRWRSLISSDGAAWLLNTDLIWKATGWTYNVSRACPFFERMRNLDPSAFSRALVGYDTSRLVEKIDWMRLLCVKLLWEDLVCTPSEGGWVAPDWALKISDSKAAFHFTIIEMARDTPLNCELPRQKWNLIFNTHPAHVFEIQFFADHTMTSTSHPGATFRWNLEARMRYGEPSLRIENFPLHFISRRRDGLWQMANASVVIIQQAPPPGDLPLFDDEP
jgi:hypothetical protein